MLDTFAGARGRRAPPVNLAGANSPIPIATDLPTVRVVTYNIHTCVGVDRRYDPARIVAVLRGIDADIACLQEVDARRRIERHADQWAYLSEATGCQVVLGGGDRRGRFDNAILTRFPVLAARTLDLTVAGYEPRGAIDADLLIGDRVLRVIATHLGLRASERRRGRASTGATAASRAWCVRWTGRSFDAAAAALILRPMGATNGGRHRR